MARPCHEGEWQDGYRSGAGRWWYEQLMPPSSRSNTTPLELPEGSGTFYRAVSRSVHCYDGEWRKGVFHGLGAFRDDATGVTMRGMWRGLTRALFQDGWN